jgi:hypothetical protein
MMPGGIVLADDVSDYPLWVATKEVIPRDSMVRR